MKIKLITILSLLALTTSCISTRTTASQHVYSSEKLKETKSEGKACGYVILGIIFFGDMTVDKAAKSADISEVAFVESKTASYPFFTSICTIVKGK